VAVVEDPVQMPRQQAATSSSMMTNQELGSWVILHDAPDIWGKAPDTRAPAAG
jgi:hypothetical protein